MDPLIRSIEAEYRRYKALAEAAIDQVPEAALSQPGPANGNSLATICWHVAGNLTPWAASRRHEPAAESSLAFRSSFWLKLHNCLHQGSRRRAGLGWEALDGLR